VLQHTSDDYRRKSHDYRRKSCRKCAIKLLRYNTLATTTVEHAQGLIRNERNADGIVMLRDNSNAAAGTTITMRLL